MSNIIPYTNISGFNRIGDFQLDTRAKKYNSGLRSTGNFYVAGHSFGADTIRKYSYFGNAITLVWESEPLPDMVSHPDSYIRNIIINNDNSLFAIVENSDLNTNVRPASVYKIDPEGNIRQESPNLKSAPKFNDRFFYGGDSIAQDLNDEFIYAGINGDQMIAKFDKELNFLSKKLISADTGHIDPLMNRNNRLFAVEQGNSATIYEINAGDLSTLNSIALHDLDGINISRSKGSTMDINNRVIIACTGDSNGHIVILDEDLNVFKVLSGSNIGFKITSTTDVATTIEGFIAVANGDNKIYLIDPKSEALLWENSSNSDGLASSRPKEVHADTFGNIVVATGLGADPEYVLIYDIEGNSLLNIGVGSTAMAIHPSDWQVRVNNAKSPKISNIIPDPVNLSILSKSSDNLEITWEYEQTALIYGFDLYLNGQKYNTELLPVDSKESFLITGLNVDTEYEIAVVAAGNKGVESNVSETLTASTADIPATPTGLNGQASTDSIDLDWDDNTESDIAGYNVFIDGLKDNNELIANSNYTAENLNSDQEYEVSVTAVNEYTSESPKSPKIFIKTLIPCDIAINSIDVVDDPGGKKVTISATTSSPPIQYRVKQLDAVLYPYQSSNQFIINESGDFLVQTKDDNNCGAQASFNIQGAPSGYTEVSTPQDLRDINNDLNGKYYLVNDIDMADYGNFIPVGVDDQGDVISEFSGEFNGEFNGGGHVISNFTSRTDMDSWTGRDRGLFRRLHDGVILNLGMKNVDLYGTLRFHTVGAIVGNSNGSGSIKNCYVTGGTIESTYTGDAGGIIGQDQFTLATYENLYSSVDVIADDSGGIFGKNSGSSTIISNCYFDNSKNGGVGSGSTAIGKTPAELMQQATFNNWDFQNVWQIDEGNDFPRLIKGII